MDFIFIEPNGGELRLPVSPSQLTVRHQQHKETIQFITKGEVDFPKGKKIDEISFSSFFPLYYDESYCQYKDFPTPLEATTMLNGWIESKKPVRLVISQIDLSMLVFIDGFTTTYKGGEPGDIYYDLTCREWREVSIKQVNTLKQTTNRSDTKKTSSIYVVKSGDSLYRIAKKELGSGPRWSEIYQLNKGVIGNNPNLIYPGQKLVMPS
ncbi:LysM peptidoglycan-binding domain-containing protein [Chengkuizengella sp. SCS-71B]|uniref:LysM peptidoglycan-binding domain-containing protein n=1 Tax=Chengkuizengella sp. SCS-71B TaxID=3115290 RepID=UPI0032C22686